MLLCPSMAVLFSYDKSAREAWQRWFSIRAVREACCPFVVPTIYIGTKRNFLQITGQILFGDLTFGTWRNCDIFCYLLHPHPAIGEEERRLPSPHREIPPPPG